MDDAITITRINQLHPKLREETLNAYRHVNNTLLGKGVRLRFAYTYRTNKEQAALYAQGRTKPGIKVTNANAWQSIHNYGLAFDIVLLLDKNLDGNFETATWDMISDFDKDGLSDWMEVVNYFKSIGWEWGGDWRSFPDMPHFQKTFGYTWQSLKNMVNEGKWIESNGLIYPNI